MSLGNAKIQSPAEGSAYTLEMASLLLTSFPPQLAVLLWPGPPSPSSPWPQEGCEGSHHDRPRVLPCAQGQGQVTTTTSFPLLPLALETVLVAWKIRDICNLRLFKVKKKARRRVWRGKRTHRPTGQLRAGGL